MFGDTKYEIFQKNREKCVQKVSSILKYKHAGLKMQDFMSSRFNMYATHGAFPMSRLHNYNYF